MSSILPLIILVLISLFMVWRIYRDVKLKKSKSTIILEVILLMGIIAFSVVYQIRSGKERRPEEGSVETTKEEKSIETESARATKLLSGLQDYMGELSQTDQPQVQLFLRQGLEYKINEEHSQALQVFRQALDLNLTEGERLAFFVLMGNSEAFLKEYDSAINHYFQAERLGKNTNDDTALVVIYTNLALAFQLKDDLKGAVEALFNLLAIDRKMGNKSGEKNALANIGFIYQIKGNADSAEVYHKKSLDVTGTADDPLTQAAQMNNLAMAYRSKNMLDSALVLYSQALVLFQQAGDPKDAASVLTNLGLTYQEAGNLEQALIYHHQAFAIDSALGDLMGQAGDLTNMGSAMEQEGEFAKALEFYQRSVYLFEKANAQKEVEFVRENIRRVEKKIKG